MYLDERSNLLLKEVLANPEISNTVLEEKHQLSRRQVSYSFKKINEWLEEKNYPTIKRTNSGKFIVNPKLIDLLAKKSEKTNTKYIPSEKERAQLILLMILSCDEDLSLIHFTSALEISKNTVLRDLKLAQSMINPYQLEIVYSRIHGYDLSGSEWDKRKVLVELLQSIFGIYNGESFIQELIQISGEEINVIRNQMEEVETRLHLKFIDEKIKILPYIIAIILKRIKVGKLITDSFHIDYKELSDTKEYEAAELLMPSVENISEAERLFLTLQLLTSNVLSSDRLTDADLPQLKRALEECLYLFEKKACITLKDKEVLLQRLFQHMKPAYYRIKYHLTADYSIIEKGSERFEAVHYIVKDSIKPLEDYIGCEIPESEQMFITIYVGGHLINIGETIHLKKKAVVVCPNGISISKLMENTLRELFPEFYFYDALSIREFERLNMEWDIVFSPVPLQTDKHLFIVERFITDYEKVQLRQRVMKQIFGLNSSIINVEQIMNIIEKYVKVEEKQSLLNALQDYFSSQKTGEVQQKQDYNLADLITPDMMLLTDSVSSWEEAISLASEPLLKTGIISDAYVNAMKTQYPTMTPHIVLRQNIAIPHSSPDDGVNSIGMSLLVLKNGIDFDGSHKVHLIVVIAAVDKNQHFNALKQLLKLSGVKEDIDQIIAMNSENEIYEKIIAYSK